MHPAAHAHGTLVVDEGAVGHARRAVHAAIDAAAVVLCDVRVERTVTEDRAGASRRGVDVDAPAVEAVVVLDHEVDELRAGRVHDPVDGDSSSSGVGRADDRAVSQCEPVDDAGRVLTAPEEPEQTVPRTRGVVKCRRCRAVSASQHDVLRAEVDVAVARGRVRARVHEDGVALGRGVHSRLDINVVAAAGDVHDDGRSPGGGESGAEECRDHCSTHGVPLFGARKRAGISRAARAASGPSPGPSPARRARTRGLAGRPAPRPSCPAARPTCNT